MPADRLWPTINTGGPTLVRATLTDPKKIVRHMADDIRLAVATRDGVTPDDMLVAGWTKKQVETHKAAAIERASTLGVR